MRMQLAPCFLTLELYLQTLLQGSFRDDVNLKLPIHRQTERVLNCLFHRKNTKSLLFNSAN